MKYISLVVLLCLPILLKAQDTVKIYNPYADAASDIKQAVSLAREQNKHVLLQIGGNWCPWCIRLHGFMKTENQIDSILKADYIRVMVNYSKENKNPDVLASLGYPQRFGFPVLLILDQNGNRLHTQDSGLLEQGKGYDAEKIKRFLLEWNVTALNPATYTK